MVDRYRSRIQVPRVAATAPQVSSGAIVADGVASLAGAAQTEASRRLQERAQADDAVAYASAVSRYEVGLRALEREEETNAGPGGSGYVGAVDARRQDLADEVLGALPAYVSQIGRSRITQAFTASNAESSARAALWADDQNKRWRADSIQEVLNTRYLALKADPTAAAAVQADLSALIAGAGMDPTTTRAMTRAMTVEVGNGAVAGFLAQGKVDDALAVIDRLSPELSPSEQRSLDNVISQWATSTGLAAVQDQHDRVVSSMLYGPTRDLDAATAYLEQNRDAMTADDYGQQIKALYELRTAGPDRSDPANLLVEADFETAIDSGAWSTAQVDTALRDMTADGRIGDTTYNRLWARRNALEDRTMKTGLDYIEAAFKQSEFATNYDNSRALARADAINAFVLWRQANQQATAADVREAATIIATQFTADDMAALPDVGAYGRPSDLASLEVIRSRIAADAGTGVITATDQAELEEIMRAYWDRLMIKEMSVQ